MLRLKQEDFELANIELKHCTESFKYIISSILDQYFAKKLKVQKVYCNSKS